MNLTNTDLEPLSDEADDLDDEDTLDGRYLVFSLGDRSYGIEIKFITEIVGMQNITEIPDMPSFIKGVINLRGKVIAVVDVRDRFKMESIGYNDKTCVIILSVNFQLIGLIVDTVKEVIKIAEQNKEEAPRFGDHEGSQFISSIAKVNEDVKVLLNIDKLLKDDDKQAIETAINNQ